MVIMAISYSNYEGRDNMGQYGNSFHYNGKSSSEFNLMIAGFQVIDIPLNLKRSTMISSMNRYRHRVNMYGINYDSVLGFTLQLIKNPCSHQIIDSNELKFTRAEIREISAWLTSPISPRLFHMTDFESKNGQNEDEYDYYGVFTNVEASDNGIYCLECTFECTTPYALSGEQTITIEQGEGIVVNQSDEYEDYVYPTIIIEPTSTLLAPYDITLTNDTDDGKSITLKNMKRGDTVTMDCEKMTIKNKSGSLISFDDLDIDALDYIYWFRLLHGNNRILISGDATVTFVFRYPVKVGAY